MNIVQDPVVGLFAFGGSVEYVNGFYIIRPKDGVQQRFTLFCAGNLTVRLERVQLYKSSRRTRWVLQSSWDVRHVIPSRMRCNRATCQRRSQGITSLPPHEAAIPYDDKYEEKGPQL